jgi:Protein of unknown function (DUF3604)
MHRNVFFKDCAKVPVQSFSSLDSQAPEDLWNWMDGQRKAGNELLAISHNANVSGGLMYPTEVDFKGRPIDRAWAESRDRNERLTEIKQITASPARSPRSGCRAVTFRSHSFRSTSASSLGSLPSSGLFWVRSQSPGVSRFRRS